MQWRYRETVLAVAVLANVSQFGARLVVSPLVPRLVSGFRVSTAELGLVLTGMWALFALAQYPSGVLADVYGERRVILAAMVATAACSLLLAVSPVVPPMFPAFAALGLALGAGAGLYFSVGTSLLVTHYEDTGLPLSIHSVGAPIAGLVVPPAAIALALRYGVRSAFLLGTALSGTTAVLVALRVRPTPPARPDDFVRDRVRPAVIRDLFARHGFIFTFLLATLGMYVFQSSLSFFPTFLVDYRGLGEAAASSLFSVMFLLSAIAMPVVGRISDHFGRDATLVAVFLLTATGWSVLVVVPGLLGIVGVVLLGVGFSWGGVLQARFMDHLPASDRGTGFGLARSGFVLFGASGNAVTGWLADASGWPTAIAVIVGMLLAGVLAVTVNEIRRA